MTRPSQSSGAPAGTATPLHVHTREAEAFYVLDGSLTYRAGEQTHRLSAGSFIYLPAACRTPSGLPAPAQCDSSLLSYLAP